MKSSHRRLLNWLIQRIVEYEATGFAEILELGKSVIGLRGDGGGDSCGIELSLEWRGRTRGEISD